VSDSPTASKLGVEAKRVYGVAGSGGVHCEADGDVALADAGRAEQQDADATLDEPRGAQLGEALGSNSGWKETSNSSRVLWFGSPESFSLEL
jgi:hypothetical protein